VRLRWFRPINEEDPKGYAACFEHNGKPYIGKWELEGSHDKFEDIEDTLARCWDNAWGKVKKDGCE